MNNKDVAKIYDQYVLPTYKQLPVCLSKGKGSRVWDLQGKEYIDLFPGWAVSGLGHCHPDIVSAVRNQIRKVLHIPNNFYNVKQAELAREIVKASFPSKVFFCNSGAEATDAAIKFARKYGAEKGRYEIITMKQSFHGRTLAATAATGQGKVQSGFSPIPEGFCYAEFNNLESVKALVTDKTVGIFLEPVLGEGGVTVATEEFMTGLRKLCDEKGLLLIVDEVQTGMGRTGKLFAYQHFGIEPDLMTLAKSLGNGVPLGALVASNRVNEGVFTPGTHGSTYGGNPVVASAGLAVFKAIRKEKLLQNVSQLNKYMVKRFEDMKEKYTCIKEVRGLGVMMALQLDCSGMSLVESALEKGLIINCTQDNVLRIVPALNISKKILDKGLSILESVFEEAMVNV